MPVVELEYQEAIMAKKKKAQTPQPRNWLALHARIDLTNGGGRKGAGAHKRKNGYIRKDKRNNKDIYDA